MLGVTKMNIISIIKITNKYKSKVLGSTISYCVGKIVNIIENSSNIYELLENVKNLLNPYLISNIIMYILIIVTIVIYSLDFILKKILNAQKPSNRMKEIMKKHTADVISELSDKTYTWGYNYCIFYPISPQGWLPENFVIGEYDNSKYIFSKNEGSLPGYSRKNFDEYSKNNPKIDAIQRKGEDRDRFSVSHIKPNTNKKKVIIDIKLKKTSWVQLQYSWDYFRLLDNYNKPIQKANIKPIKQELINAFENQGKKYCLNSFCLHLIIETKKGVVLSRIGRGKENDYPSSWAVTIGEQIEENDFNSMINNELEYKKDFIERWVKRALEEEFGVDRDEGFEDMFIADSLRVLSVDMEADIYNIALTCVITLNKSFDDFRSTVQGKMDQIENYDLREVSLNEIIGILLKYPDNMNEYHPSTYLRLLMYYRYKKGTNALNEELVNKSKYE